MASRLIEVVLPEPIQHTLDHYLEELKPRAYWCGPLHGGAVLTTILLEGADVESVMDELERRYSSDPIFRAILLPVSAAIPKPEEPDDDEPKPPKPKARISRSELYDEITRASGLSSMFVTTVVLSAIVAMVGLLRDNTAAIIGAMVIAPLLGPNAGLALAATLGDKDLAIRSLISNFVGVTLAFVMAIAVGMTLDIDPTSPEILSRTVVSLFDIILALAAGVAGSLAFSVGAPSALVGVMVAVALLPPTVVCGMLAGAGHHHAASGAFLLLAVNVSSVNLAGIVTYLAQGFRPRGWREKDQARWVSFIAVTIWVCALALLAVLVTVAL